MPVLIIAAAYMWLTSSFDDWLDKHNAEASATLLIVFIAMGTALNFELAKRLSSKISVTWFRLTNEEEEFLDVFHKTELERYHLRLEAAKLDLEESIRRERPSVVLLPTTTEESITAALPSAE